MLHHLPLAGLELIEPEMLLQQRRRRLSHDFPGVKEREQIPNSSQYTPKTPSRK